jgi:hypothetical protein
MPDHEKIFTEMYAKKLWGNSPSASGTGSDNEQTKLV